MSTKQMPSNEYSPLYEFGKWLREECKLQNISLASVASISKIPATTIYNYASDERKAIMPSLLHFVKICKALRYAVVLESTVQYHRANNLGKNTDLRLVNISDTLYCTLQNNHITTTDELFCNIDNLPSLPGVGQKALNTLYDLLRSLGYKL